MRRNIQQLSCCCRRRAIARVCSAAFALAVMTLVLGCSREGGQLTGIKRTDLGSANKIAEFDPEYALPKSIVLSPDKRHVGYVLRAANRPEKWRVAKDDGGGSLHDGIIEGSLVVAPDSSSLAYIARNGKDIHFVRMREKKSRISSSTFDWIEPSSVVFSQDGQRVAYAAYTYHQQGERTVVKAVRVVIDDVPGKAYDDVSELTFSPDGSHFAYVATRGTRHFVVYDGTEYPKGGKGAAGISMIRFSPDSSRFAFRLTRGRQEPGSDKPTPRRESIVVNGASGKEYDWILGTGILRSERGGDVHFDASGSVRYLAYLESEPHEYDLLLIEQTLDGNATEKHLTKLSDNRDAVDSFTVSPDGKHVAFITHSGDGWKLVTDQAESRTYDDLWSATITFSPNSESVACLVEDDGEFRVLVDGRTEHDAYEAIVATSLLFSPDGKRLAYVAQEDGKQFVVLDDKEGEKYDLVREMAFGPNGKRFGYIGVDEDEQTVVIDGQPVATHQNADALVFGPRGNHYGYVARDSENPGKESVVIDDRKGANWDSILRPGGNTFHMTDTGMWNFIAGDACAADESIHFYTVAARPK